MNVTRRRTTTLGTAVIGALAAGSVAFALVNDADADVVGRDRGTTTIPGSKSSDVRLGRVLAAYVAPDELVFDAGDGNVSLPVAGDVVITIDGERVDYGDFTLSFDPARGDGPGGAATATYRVTVEDDVVVAIER